MPLNMVGGLQLFSTRLIGGNMVKRRLILVVLGLLLASTGALSGQGQTNSPLKLIQKIPMPNVRGRMDHLGVDVAGRRLFADALGDDQHTVEGIDLKANKRVISITGQSMPQGVFYSPDFKTLFVANGKDG